MNDIDNNDDDYDNNDNDDSDKVDDGPLSVSGQLRTYPSLDSTPVN